MRLAKEILIVTTFKPWETKLKNIVDIRFPNELTRNWCVIYLVKQTSQSV